MPKASAIKLYRPTDSAAVLAILSGVDKRAYPYSSGAIVGYLWSDKELGHDASDSG